jgi:hypothetical protein
MQTDTLSEAPAASGGNAGSDLGAAFGALLGVLPKEVLGQIIPAERAVMLRRVSRGARGALAAVQPAAKVQVKQAHRIAGLAGILEKMLSWCRITVLQLCGELGGELADVEGVVGVLGQCGSLAHLDLSGNSIRAEGAGRLRASGTEVDITFDSDEEGEEDEEEDDEEQEEEQEEEEGEEEEGEEEEGLA